VLDDSNVICCTNTGAGDRVFKRELFKTIFDLVVIDECAQAVEVSCWLPALKGRRLVLAGDHKQLPPTIKCKNSQDLAYTLFDRAAKECPVTSTLLSTQYRMNEAIMNWSSDQFYEGRLVADASVKSHTINGLREIKEVKVPLMLIDTAGSKMGENLDRDDNDLSRSKFNLGEADLVKVVYL
jgi:ATP-dependent RNA/DNA helicase IGHMBP2